MGFAKRIVLFLAVNILVMLTVTFLLNLLGVGNYITPHGIDMSQLAIFCLVWGMAGSMISLGLSRIMAKMMMGVQVIDPNTTDQQLSELVQRVHQLARGARLSVMPEVGIFDSPELNAFATGPTKSRALVAVSTGLLQRMNDKEVNGVLAHEVSHIANGDMVTMTLIQGIVNAFVMFLSRVIAFAITQAGRSNDRDNRGGVGMSYYMISMLLEVVFMILGSIVVAWFSRLREFRADAGGASLSGNDSMIGALRALQRHYEIVDPSAQPSIQSLKISGHGGFLKLFSTHPPLADRIARLEARGA